MNPPQFKPETILIADLLDYLERHKLRVTKVELWRERGLVVYTNFEDNTDVIQEEMPQMREPEQV